METARAYVIPHGWDIVLADIGISPANVLRRAALPADFFAKTPTNLQPEHFFRFWQALDDEAADPALPIRIARTISVETFAPPIFAAICSPDLNVAAERIARYKPLIGPMRMRVERSETETTLEIVWPEHLRPPRALALMELIFWVALARLATRAEIRPRRMTALDPPADAEPFRRYLGIPVTPGDARTLTFSAEDAARPFLTANEPMWEFFEPDLRRRLSELDAGSTVTERVRAVLLELLPAGEATMEIVARRLVLSARTLQRRLQDEGTSFRAVLDSTRERLARHYLSSSALPAAEISFLLGYEDPNSFYRAFHGWTGDTPEGVRSAAIRQAALGAGQRTVYPTAR
jgi:AraC-like DNA-binding protein